MRKLTTKKEYQKLARKSHRLVGTYVVIDTCPNNLSYVRLGMTVSRRYGKAHQRNRFKRQLREAFRACHTELASGMDINVRPRHHAHFAKTGQIMGDLLKLIGSDVSKRSLCHSQS